MRPRRILSRMEEYELVEYAAVRSRLAPVSLAPAAARSLGATGWAEPYEMLTGLEAIRLTDEGMRAYARLV